jgi:AcrR family transcriptional regulator
MPQPARVTPDQLLAAARTLLEHEGIDGLTMRALARHLGLAAPSLYFHVESREDLLRLLTQRGLLDFSEYLGGEIADVADPREKLHLLADAYARFAAANPQLFVLLFGPCPEERLVSPTLAEAASAPLLDALAELVPAEQVVSVSQALWSLTHGYTTLSLANQFRLGGAPGEAMHEAIDLLLAGLRVATPATAR